MPQTLRSVVACCLFASACNLWSSARLDPSAGGTANGSGAIYTNLPCDVDAVLSTYCRTCHGPVPLGGAPMSLITYDDLMAPAKSDPSQRVADVCLARMQDPSSPMPPTPPAMAAADVQTFAAWLGGGAPMGDCVIGNDPLNAAPTCTSGATWNGGDDGSSRMHPGRACIDCHSQSREGPRFAIAGTVYPTGHEPNDCNAADVGGAQVVITDANGATLTLNANAVGNFYTSHAVALPYRAKVTYMGRTRAMSAAQTSGDCNACHTQDGANNAPGRITAP
jgi:hypothetical protein